jgi:hypothetical protein
MGKQIGNSAKGNSPVTCEFCYIELALPVRRQVNETR